MSDATTEQHWTKNPVYRAAGGLQAKRIYVWEPDRWGTMVARIATKFTADEIQAAIEATTVGIQEWRDRASKSNAGGDLFDALRGPHDAGYAVDMMREALEAQSATKHPSI